MNAAAKILLLPVLLSACSQEGSNPRSDATGVGGEASSCLDYFLRIEGCVTTFARIASDPIALDGRTVILTGYLGIDSGRLFLYPSKEAYDYADNANSIYFDVAFEVATGWATRRAGKYVKVVGPFSANFPKKDFGVRLGSMAPSKEPAQLGIHPVDRSRSEITFTVDLEESSTERNE